MRQINGDALKEILEDHARKYGKKQGSDFIQGCHCGIMLAITELDDIESEETEPLRHGHWAWIDDANYPGTKILSCSVCNGGGREGFLFCPHCGARMDEVTENAET